MRAISGSFTEADGAAFVLAMQPWCDNKAVELQKKLAPGMRVGATLVLRKDTDIHGGRHQIGIVMVKVITPAGKSVVIEDPWAAFPSSDFLAQLALVAG